jgi:8-oxo-dGTP diphosphatase
VEPPRVGVDVIVMRDARVLVREAAKCVQWVWCRWSELPEPLFAPLASLRRSGFVAVTA